MKPIVAIVGRPNVGKSALFNRIVGSRRAIIKDEPGVTRDVNYADTGALGRAFVLVDTGGFEPVTTSDMMAKVREQALLAIEEADVIVFLMDGRTGPVTQDREVAAILRKTGKKVIYAANKIDTKNLMPETAEFYSLGVDEVCPVSAEHGLGVAELIDRIVQALPGKAEEEAEDENIVKVAIVGRPNAGKSSLLNRLVGKKRSIVSEVPGTTRDSIDTLYVKGDKKYLFIDTAGIRKKGKISAKLETYAVISAIKSIDRCDIALLVIDGKDGFGVQDERIAGLLSDRGKACIIVVNKWDIVEKDDKTTKRYTDDIRHRAPFITYAPVEFVSALSGKRVVDIFGIVDDVMVEMGTKFKTSQLNDFLGKFVDHYSPPAYSGKEVKLYYATQTGTNPPRFTVFVNVPKGITDSYRRYLINSFREALKLSSVPIKMNFRARR